MGRVLRATAGYLRERLRRRGELIPVGYSWTFVVTVDVTLVLIAINSTMQRPASDLPVAVGAGLLAISPMLFFFFSGLKFSPATVSVAAWGATAMFLFGTSTPVVGDFAPLFVVLMSGVVAALASVPLGVCAAAAGAVLLTAAAFAHRLDMLLLYLAVVAMGWLVGFLMHTQQQLMIKQDEAQAALARHAAADERRRIAREVHDVIAHSLSVTLLHVTGARRALQQDHDIDDAVEALQEAENLGRQAMADIRRTVGLLDGAPLKLAPEPGVDDIASLVDDFSRAGLAATLRVDGPTGAVSAAVGLALYRITQESLANIAKHAPDSKATVELAISRSTAGLTVVNTLPVGAVAPGSEGRGVRGMRQRVELLGGVVDIGPTHEEWSVRAEIPLGEGHGGGRFGWCTA